MSLAFIPVAMSAQPVAAAALATLDQCQNGQSSPSLVLAPCLNGTLDSTTYTDWANGDLNNTNSHWKEGQFVPYRTYMTGLSGGTHTLVFHYETVHNTIHALDYIGSYDATETTSPAAGPENRNDSNPCTDILDSDGCTAPGTPPVPSGTIAVPSADLSAEKTCAGASGLPGTPVQTPGDINIFAPGAASATLTDAHYVSENVAVGVNCTTTMSVSFDLVSPAPSGGWSAVLAWGGHLASPLDWGAGNSSGDISGSAFHMALDTLDGNSAGAQDRSINVNAIAPRPTVSTSVSTTSITKGGTLTDTATLTGSNGTVTGTVDFQLCTNTTTGCPQGTGTTFQSNVPLDSTGSAVSASFGSNLSPGNYCVGVVYNNDDNSYYSGTYSGSGTSECFTVKPKATPSASTTLSQNPVTAGSQVHDSAALTGATSNAGGTVDYRYYTSLSDCQADTSAFPGTVPSRGTDVGSVTVTNATVPDSPSVTLPTGTYDWAAFYSGDASNTGVASDCTTEVLTVQSKHVKVKTFLSKHKIFVGDPVRDHAVLSGATADAAGTVKYRYYASVSACKADTAAWPATVLHGHSAGTVTVTNGSVPPSNYVRFWKPGTFFWAAFYSGDARNSPAASNCWKEKLKVTQKLTCIWPCWLSHLLSLFPADSFWAQLP